MRVSEVISARGLFPAAASAQPTPTSRRLFPLSLLSSRISPLLVHHLIKGQRSTAEEEE